MQYDDAPLPFCPCCETNTHVQKTAGGNWCDNCGCQWKEKYRRKTDSFAITDVAQAIADELKYCNEDSAWMAKQSVNDVAHRLAKRLPESEREKFYDRIGFDVIGRVRQENKP